MFISKEFIYFDSSNANDMEKTKTTLQIGSKLYWVDQPETLAGTVVRFTTKRDCIINFVSGNELGEKSYPVRMANGFIVKI